MKTSLLTIVAFGMAFATASAAQTPLPVTTVYAFVTHAAFYSLETKQANIVDPHVFTDDVNAVAGSGPQGIAHVVGFRPAFGVDDPSATIANAHGDSLNMMLGNWFGCRGSVTLTPKADTTAASFEFVGLVPSGRYSLFENHFSEAGVTFSALDGTATTNSFTASRDGRASLALVIPGAVTHAEGIVLVYHSDGHDHGLDLGQLGVTAHHQLIVRIP